ELYLVDLNCRYIPEPQVGPVRDELAILPDSDPTISTPRCIELHHHFVADPLASRRNDVRAGNEVLPEGLLAVARRPVRVPVLTVRVVLFGMIDISVRV